MMQTALFKDPIHTVQ